MTAKEYLQQIHKDRRRAQALRIRIIELQRQSEGTQSVNYQTERVQTSPENAFEKTMAQIIDMKARYMRSILRCERRIANRESQIASMRKAEHTEILYLRYCEVDHSGHQLPFKMIAKRMNRSLDRTLHLHGEALAAFDKKFKISIK